MAASALHRIDPQPSGGSARRIITLLRERAWLIFLFTLLGGALATAYIQYAPKKYAATSSIKYQDSFAQYLPDKTSPQRAIHDVKRNLLSEELLKSVVNAERLQENPRFNKKLSGSEAVEAAYQTLLKRLTIQGPAEDLTLEITVTDQTPDLPVRVLNSLAVRWLEAYSKERAATFDQIMATLQTRSADILRDLRKITNPNTPISNDAPSSNEKKRLELLDQVDQLTADYLQLEVQIARQSDQVRLAKQPFENPEIALQVTSLAANRQVQSAQTILKDKQVALDEVAERYLEKHPNYIAAAKEVETARQALQNAINAAISELEKAVESTKTERDNVKQQIDTAMAEAKTLATPQIATNTTAANTSTPDEAGALKKLYDENLGELKALQYGSLAILSPIRHTPATLSKPAGPNPQQILAIGIASGLLLGLLVSLVFGYGDTSLKTVDDVEQALDLPVLSVVPRLKDSDSELAAAEGFRSLRTSISVSSRDKEPRLVQFTSTSPDEGKTFCALNFAVGLAQQGHRTVLIECDLRRPMAAPSLSLVKMDAAGVSDYLKSGTTSKSEPSPETTPAKPSGGLSFAEIRKKKVETTKPESPAPTLTSDGLSLDDVIQRTEVANLFFVAAGKPVSSPTELLASPRFEDLLNGLLQRYDRVVLDSAPVLGVSETLLIASRMQGVCFVVRGNHTPRRAVLRAVEILRRTDAPLLGAVLNGITPKKSDPYGQDYYYHRTAGRE
jgi:succinoglycan biosynthesis transport protein ExoP